MALTRKLSERQKEAIRKELEAHLDELCSDVAEAAQAAIDGFDIDNVLDDIVTELERDT